MKTRIAPARMPGAHSGMMTRERRPGPRAEIGRGFQQVAVQPFERRVKRQHHERQIAVDQAEDHRAVVVEQRQRLVNQAEPSAARC